MPCAITSRPRERRAAGWLPYCPLRAGGREIKICSAPLSEQHSSAGLDAAAQRRKKGRKCLFRRFPVKPGRPGGKRLLGRRTSISGPATTERGSLRAHLAELVAGPSIAALYPPRVGLPCAILPRPRERQAAGWLLHCPLQSSQRRFCTAIAHAARSCTWFLVPGPAIREPGGRGGQESSQAVFYECARPRAAKDPPGVAGPGGGGWRE